jgi:hypothetical protein
MTTNILSSIVLGLVIPGALSIYLFFKAHRFKQVVFTGLFANLQTRNHPEISISFRGNEIDNLSKFLVLCWNGGNEEIRHNDIPSEEPPTIQFSENVRMLSFRLLEASSPGLNFRPEPVDGRTLALRFEYLNPKDGGVIEILYETLNKEAVNVDVSARIIGGHNSVEDSYRPENKTIRIVPLLFAGLIALGSVFLLIGNTKSTVIGFVYVILAAVFGVVWWFYRKHYSGRRVPNFAVKYFEGKS